MNTLRVILVRSLGGLVGILLFVGDCAQQQHIIACFPGRVGSSPRTQARAHELQLETQVIGRLDSLLKRCGRDPGSDQAISNWLCAEGLEGHAKKGLSRILW